MATPPLIGPGGTIPVYGQNVASPLSYAFAPGNAVGPLPSGPGQAPLATLPPGTTSNYGADSMQRGGAAFTAGGGGIMGNFSLHVWAVLAGLFVVGIIVLDRVHWRG